MSPAEVAETVRVKLAAQIDEDLDALKHLSGNITRLTERSDDPDREWLRVRALSFELERWYTAMESTIDRALRQLDGEAPEGRSWHDELLRAAAVALAGLRPALISHEAAEALREVMRFRHFARHGYDREPDGDRVDELARVALGAHDVCALSLRELCAWLRQKRS